ncbi:MAG: ice-binding family protein [Patescibacteria group bacterium]
MKILNKVLMVLLAVSFAFTATNTTLAATTISLGTAGNFAVLGGSTITNTGSTVLNGDLGLTPGTSVTGFPPGTVNGSQHITNAVAAQGQTDLVTAYNAASGQTGAVTVSGDLGGRTLTPGVYNSASSLGLTGTLTLDGEGNPNAVFVFQMGSTLTTASGSNISLINGAQACNIFWQVGSSATLGTNSNFLGTLMALTSITATTGASINGRLLARNGAVTLDTNSVTKPVCTLAVTPTPTPTPTPAATPVVTPTLPKTGFNPSTTNLPLQIPVVFFVGVALMAILIKRKQTFSTKS